MRRLHLSIYKKWFEEILCGTKTIEYRDIKPYYEKLLKNHYDEVKFVNGYGRERSFLVIKITKIIKGKEFYEIHLGNIIETGNL
ncbi:MAG: ASCH domain-containing protein [Ignavibacteria bacterium]|nr:ASCH domain-containing protein [Ignavibacteria bacterium]